MTRRSLLPAAGLTLMVLVTAGPRQDDALLGFTREQATRQRQLEARFDDLLNGDNLRVWMQRMVARPTHVGAPHTRENAEFMAGLFRSWGYETRIDTFHVLFPTPKTRVVELLEPTRFRARLEEPVIAGDATSGVTENRLPVYNAYSADGDVTGELVYVNYGVPDDYEELARRGIDVAGKIVIARYGGSWRGIKPKVAAEHGAIGCILYSDPRDDGYFQGDVYPVGPYRMAYGAQRGSVQDMPLHPGDPLTPFIGATRDAERLTVETAPTVMKIPVLPISYADAEPLLRAIGGPVAPEAWRGALPLTYHLGPGPARVRLHLEFNWDLAPAYDVIATMPGAVYPDQWVIRGNHFDGWAFGAADPISGMVALLEEARAVGELVRTGWRPARSIVYAAWDAEEPGLLGSTEWGEHHAAELRQKAVAYINTDGNGRGFLNVGGSHTLERFVNEVARDVVDPQTGVTVLERRRAAARVAGDDEARTRSDWRISPLGSGSDYTPFLQHLGIASLNLSFGGESGGGSYHSIFDSFDHYTRFGDPGFAYGVALAQTTGRVTLRLANADVIPLQFANFADNVSQYVDEITTLTTAMREETQRVNALIRDDAYRLAADPTRTYHPPEPKEPVPFLNFAPVQNALVRLDTASQRYDTQLRRGLAQNALTPSDREALDAVLISTERLMTRPDGLPRRPWFRHQVYAPGFYTGYGVKTLPGIREAIEQRAWDEATEQIDRVAETLHRVADAIGEATRILSGNAPTP